LVKVQLNKVDKIHELRRANYAFIKGCFDEMPNDVRVITESDSAFTSWFGVPIVCESTAVKHALQQFFRNRRHSNTQLFCWESFVASGL